MAGKVQGKWNESSRERMVQGTNGPENESSIMGTNVPGNKSSSSSSSSVFIMTTDKTQMKLQYSIKNKVCVG